MNNRVGLVGTVRVLIQVLMGKLLVLISNLFQLVQALSSRSRYFLEEAAKLFLPGPSIVWHENRKVSLVTDFSTGKQGRFGLSIHWYGEKF